MYVAIISNMAPLISLVLAITKKKLINSTSYQLSKTVYLRYTVSDFLISRINTGAADFFR